MKLDDEITIMDGAGGEAMDSLIRESIIKGIELKTAGSVSLKDMDDGASIDVDDNKLIFTIDGHTVKPIFFPGGDIGHLAISGTVNDLAVMGAKPLSIAVSLIIENGFSRQKLERIIRSMNSTSKEVPVPIITGDTKVVEDKIGIFVITAGVGHAEMTIRDSGAKIGDFVLINGGIGEHGFAVMSTREGIDFETSLKSDVSPIWEVIDSVAKEIGWENIHAMKDPTRGGLSEALNEMAMKSSAGIEIWENSVPIKPAVMAAGDMLGISPFIMANEGKVVMVIAREHAENALEIMRKFNSEAAIIGEIVPEYRKRVIMRTKIGGRRFLERPLGDPVPRVC